MSDEAPPRTYPPERHVLRDLPMEIVAVDALRSQVRLEVGPHLTEGGVVSAGPLMTAIDVLGGGLCGRVVAPDWMATADLSLHLGDAPSAGLVVMDAEVIRNGRNTVVVEVVVGAGDDPDAEPFGDAVLTFMRLPRRDTTLDLSSAGIAFGEPMSFALPGSGLSRPFTESIGLVIDDPAAGVTTTPAGAYVQNSFGAVNGGVVAAIADASARSMGRCVLGVEVRTVDAEIHYMVQGKVGPLLTESRVVRRRAGHVGLRTEVFDTGSPGPDGTPARMVLAHFVVESTRS